jgi:hydroxypyruvate reductase
MTDLEDLLIDTFRHAVLAAHPDTTLPRHLLTALSPGTLVIGAGKAAASMAATVEAHWQDSAPPRGIVLTRHGHRAPTRHIEVVEAGHPLPDEAGPAACECMLTLLDGVGPQDHVLVLLSGGGSSLLTLPEDALQLGDIRQVSNDLLRSGAPIHEINVVRKKLSRMLGGKLAARCSAAATVLIISDVVGDDPRVIASGPFHPDATDHADALRILAKWSVRPPDSVMAYLSVPSARARVHGSASRDRRVSTHVVANAATALHGAADFLEMLGFDVHVLGDDFDDEARRLGEAHAKCALDLAQCARRSSKPIALLSGGETVVRVSGQGRGGRNTEYLLSLMLHLRGHPGIYAMAADTDGIDGTQDNAGAFITPDAWRDALRLGLDAEAYLEDNDAYGFFADLGALVVTGPTRTNVNDFRLILIT